MRYRWTTTIVEAWHNIDDGEPKPPWLGEVACQLTGGRFAVETRLGTTIAELGDWIFRHDNGGASTMGDVDFRAMFKPYEELPRP